MRSYNHWEKTESPAGLWPRIKAMALDWVLILLLAGMLAGATLTFLRLIPGYQWLFATPLRQDLMSFLLLILPVIVYFGLQESGIYQATWGKRRLDLRVVRTDGAPLSRGRALARSALKFLPWQLGHTAVFQTIAAQPAFPPFLIVVYTLCYGLVIVYLLFIWRNGRAPYDLLTDSVVIVDEEDF